VELGLHTGDAIALSMRGDVPDEVHAAVDTATQAIRDGRIAVPDTPDFAGSEYQPETVSA
ncbi:MAG: hypothetical protein VW405_12740, partial [Rhodospirillaceae bacterium]